MIRMNFQVFVNYTDYSEIQNAMLKQLQEG